MTRRLAVLLSLAAVLAIPSVAWAGTVKLDDFSGNADFNTNAPNGGGAFLATTVGGPLGNISFITFCIEFNEHFSYGGTYDYSLSTGATHGGVSGGDPDPVDVATQWLYLEVVTNGYASLTGQFGTGNVGVRVQEAIWLIEGERQPGEITDAGSITLAAYAQTQNLSAFSGYTVYAMNLTNMDAGHTPAQDQLAYTGPGVTLLDAGVPEPATLILLGSGLLLTSRKLLRRKPRA